jgi:signal transduction histidine kinase
MVRSLPPRSRLVDAALVLAMALVGLAILIWAPTDDWYREPSVFAGLLVVGSAASLWWWRTAPLVSLIASCAVFMVNIVAGFPVGITQYPAFIAFYAVFAFGGLRSRWSAAGLLALTVVVYAIADRGPIDVNAFVGIGVATALAALLGDAARNRRELGEAQRAAVLFQAREQEAMRDRLVLEERARLARELHDSLGHAVNVMVMQAGVARHVFDEKPEFARQALEQVENVGRVALGELDAVLRVLRPVDGEQRAAPDVANLAGIDALCDRIRATGREVDLRVEPVELTPTAERAAYRIVQEALTNAARHSESGLIEVSIRSDNGDAVITVHNTGVHNRGQTFTGKGSGRGLVNMRERAHLEGGELESGPVADGFLVRASLPLREDDR